MNTILNKMEENKLTYDEIKLLLKMENKNITFINGWQICTYIRNAERKKRKIFEKKTKKELRKDFIVAFENKKKEIKLLENSLNTHIKILDSYRSDINIMKNKIEKYEAFIKQSMLIFN